MSLRARENPFRVDRVLTIRYRFLEQTQPQLLAELARRNYRGALVGPEGSGKTTLLEDLAQPLRAMGFATHWLQLTRERPRFDREQFDCLVRGLTSRDVILLDGAEQLSRWGWFRFLRRTRAAGGVIITSHRPGLLPTLLECHTTPELFRDLVRQLIGPAADIWGPLLDTLYANHHGNLRFALRELYDLAAAGQLELGDTATIHGGS